MAFPDDLADVAAFKIHPAIGCARLANNDDYYEFFDYEEKRKAGQAQSLKYMTMRDGKHWIMRQAVRFRIFAYRSDGGEIGELTEDDHGSARGERDLDRERGQSKAQCLVQRSDARGCGGGFCHCRTRRSDWKATIPGARARSGLAKSQAMACSYRRKEACIGRPQDNVIPPYGAHRSDNGVLDTTSDGSISVSLDRRRQHSDRARLRHRRSAGSLPRCEPGANRQFPEQGLREGNQAAFAHTSKMPPSSGVGYGMDIAMMKTINADYNPGMEICLDGDVALPDPAGAFFPRGQQHIDTNEIRPSYASAQARSVDRRTLLGLANRSECLPELLDVDLPQ